MTDPDDLGSVICEIHIRAGDRSPLHLISEDMMAHFEQVEAELERLKAVERDGSALVGSAGFEPATPTV